MPVPVLKKDKIIEIYVADKNIQFFKYSFYRKLAGVKKMKRVKNSKYSFWKRHELFKEEEVYEVI